MGYPITARGRRTNGTMIIHNVSDNHPRKQVNCKTLLSNPLIKKNPNSDHVLITRLSKIIPKRFIFYGFFFFARVYHQGIKSEWGNKISSGFPFSHWFSFKAIFPKAILFHLRFNMSAVWIRMNGDLRILRISNTAPSIVPSLRGMGRVMLEGTNSRHGFSSVFVKLSY